jgi:hypothetical protein
VQPGRHLEHRREAPVLTSELREPVGIAHRLRAGELPLDLLGAGERVVQSIAEAQLSLPYF